MRKITYSIFNQSSFLKNPEISFYLHEVFEGFASNFPLLNAIEVTLNDTFLVENILFKQNNFELFKKTKILKIEITFYSFRNNKGGISKQEPHDVISKIKSVMSEAVIYYQENFIEKKL
jgi:hypothetical protein